MHKWIENEEQISYDCKNLRNVVKTSVVARITDIVSSLLTNKVLHMFSLNHLDIFRKCCKRCSSDHSRYHVVAK